MEQLPLREYFLNQALLANHLHQEHKLKKQQLVEGVIFSWVVEKIVFGTPRVIHFFLTPFLFFQEILVTIVLIKTPKIRILANSLATIQPRTRTLAGIEGTTHGRLRLTAGSQETYNDSRRGGLPYL
ncbi:hypothetical protein N9Y26_01150 [bacterium]|nr:hypothetical protein [bacterium]